MALSTPRGADGDGWGFCARQTQSGMRLIADRAAKENAARRFLFTLKPCVLNDCLLGVLARTAETNRSLYCRHCCEGRQCLHLLRSFVSVSATANTVRASRAPGLDSPATRIETNRDFAAWKQRDERAASRYALRRDRSPFAPVCRGA